jgi:hypothetical protein
MFEDVLGIFLHLFGGTRELLRLNGSIVFHAVTKDAITRVLHRYDRATMVVSEPV